MNNNHKNASIQCSVSTCSHHAGSENYCTLNTIQVGCCGGDHTVTNCRNTECASFDLGRTH